MGTVKNELAMAKEQLLALAQQPNNNKKIDIVKSLRKEIQKARKAGKTWQQIATVLSEAGINVAVATLQYATQPARKKTEAAKTVIKNVGKNTARGQAIQTQNKKEGVPPPPRPGTFIMKPDRDEL